MEEKQCIQNQAGIAGLYHMPDAAARLYYLLHAIQHRGSDGAGIAAADGTSILAHKGLGMLTEVFGHHELDELPGDMAIGHLRMKTGGDLQAENLQPIMVRAHQGSFALVMDGMITNGLSLRAQMESEGLIFQGTSGAEILAHLIQKSHGHLAEKIEEACSLIQGSYTFLLMTKNTMYAVRSMQGIRSLFYARDAAVPGSWAFATEDAAFAMLEDPEIHSVAAGQMIVLGKDGVHVRQLAASSCSGCAMENVYYSRADSTMNGINVHKSRQAAGRLLAKGEDVDADLVIGVPDTALSAAAAFAAALHKPYEIGLIKNRYIGSTFVKPTKSQRDAGMRVRLNAISSILKGKSVYLVDDSIQKGSTAKRLCQLLKEAGASQVHLRIACAPVTHACFYGTEYIPQSELAAALYSEEEMLEIFGADSIRFLDLEDFASIFPGQPCMACLNGCYPFGLQDYAALRAENEK